MDPETPVPTYRSALLDRRGAVPALRPADAGVAGHYGDPYREQRQLEAGDALVDRSHRDVVRVSGPDRLSWLHSLLTQHVADLPPATWTQALVLSPQGHVEHHLVLADDLPQDPGAVLAHVEPGTGAALVEFLRRMQFLLRVEVELVDLAVLSGADGDRLVPRDQLLATVGDAPLAGLDAYEALRVAARTPRLGLDTDHRTLPHEVWWLRDAVHLDKGCYRGQETVARVHNLGRPPRRLALLHLDGSDSVLPATGDPVHLVVDGEPGPVVGTVGSVARHHELGPVALGLLKRSVVESAGPGGAGGTALQVLTGDGDRASRVSAAVEPAVDDEPVSAAREAAQARASLLRLRPPGA